MCNMNRLWTHPVQSLICVRLFATPWTAACQASLYITNSWRLLKLMSIESVMPSNHLILCLPLLLSPSVFECLLQKHRSAVGCHSIRVFSNESVLLIRWPKYWSFSFSISPSNEYSGLISFRIDWLDQIGRAHVWTPVTHKKPHIDFINMKSLLLSSLSIDKV